MPSKRDMVEEQKLDQIETGTAKWSLPNRVLCSFG